MSDGPKCACLHVDYDPIQNDDNSWTERWRCRDCRTEFVRASVHSAPADACDHQRSKSPSQFVGAWCSDCGALVPLEYGKTYKFEGKDTPIYLADPRALAKLYPDLPWNANGNDLVLRALHEIEDARKALADRAYTTPDFAQNNTDQGGTLREGFEKVGALPDDGKTAMPQNDDPVDIGTEVVGGLLPRKWWEYIDARIDERAKARAVRVEALRSSDESTPADLNRSGVCAEGIHERCGYYDCECPCHADQVFAGDKWCKAGTPAVDAETDERGRQHPPVNKNSVEYRTGYVDGAAYADRLAEQRAADTTSDTVTVPRGQYEGLMLNCSAYLAMKEERDRFKAALDSAETDLSGPHLGDLLCAIHDDVLHNPDCRCALRMNVNFVGHRLAEKLAHGTTATREEE